MIMASIDKVNFASLNDKRYYGSDDIVSLPFRHSLLNEIREYKESLPKNHIVVEQEKDKISFLENKAFAENERLRLLRSIFAQPLTYCWLSEAVSLNFGKIDQTFSRYYTLNSKFLQCKVMYVMVNLTVIF